MDAPPPPDRKPPLTTPLRTRIFINFIPLVVILAGFAVFSYILFSRFSHEVDRYMDRIVRIEALADRMSVALVRMHTVIEGHDESEGTQQERERLQNQLEIFRNGLIVLEEDVKQGDGVALTRELESTWQNFLNQTGLHGSDWPDSGSPAERLAVSATVNRMIATLEDLSVANKESLKTAGQTFSNMRSRIRQTLLSGMLLTIGIASLCCYQMARSIFEPINEMTRATEAFANGNLDLRVPVKSKDELGTLSDSFNRMADQLQTYRKLQDDRLVELHQFMESTLGSFPDPIFLFNENGEVILKNPAANRWMEAIGARDQLPAEVESVRKRVVEQDQNIVPQEYSETLSWRIRGRKMVFLPRALRIERGHELKGVALVMHDVTRFRLMDEVKTNLIGTVSHEIKTPLTSISMVLHLLEDGSVGQLDKQQKELVTTALHDSERLLAVTQDLLDLSRLEAGETPLELQAVPLDELVQSACTTVRSSAEQRRQKIALRLPEPVPVIRVDAGRMNYVFRNLLENAIKYTPEGSEIEFEVRLPQSSRVEFLVRDQGPGIPEAFRNRIFEKFFRMPGQKESGTGLGLSIAREIVHSHGGQISVNCPNGGGSEFLVALPLKEHERDETESTDSG